MMNEHILCESPLVRVTTAHGSLEPCEHLPLYCFSSESPLPVRARDTRRVQIPAGLGGDERAGFGEEA